MNRSFVTLTSFFFATALSAQQAQPQQPMVVYFNGQPMMLTPVQQAPVATDQAIYRQGQPQMMMPQQGQMMPAMIMPQQPQYQPQAQQNPYGTLPQYVGQGAGVTGTQARRMSVPTGAPVYVRLISALASDRMIPGAPFEASLDAPLTDASGLVIAERGARVEGRISESDAAGKISGQSRLAVTLTRMMTADGKTLDLQTNTISLAGGTSYGKDVAKIAGLAAVGTALGALNSGRGAAIGSAAGAAAGAGWVLNSRGKGTVIPSETRLEFHLIAPVTFVTW